MLILYFQGFRYVSFKLSSKIGPITKAWDTYEVNTNEHKQINVMQYFVYWCNSDLLVNLFSAFSTRNETLRMTALPIVK